MDPVDEWTAAQRRVSELMAEVSAEEAARSVPACPDWSSRELLAHMVGLGADVVAGNEDDDHNSAWTQRQVDARADRGVSELLGEWAGIVPRMQAWIGEHGPRPLGDVIIHEQDLRGALQRSGGQDTAGLAAIRDTMAERWAGKVQEAGLAPARLVSTSWTYASHEGEPGMVLEAPAFDLARAIMSRRSGDQLRSWVGRGDIDPYLSTFEVLGPLPASDLTE